MPGYDVAIVGGGMAGMVCANYLTRMGRSVLVAEQSYHTGGNMTGFRRRGFYFDGGDQSFESLGVVFPILEELGVYDSRDWTKVRYRMISKDFDFFLDSLDDVEEALLEAFPDETGLSTLFAEVRRVSRFLDRHCDPWSFPLIHDFHLGRLAGLIRWLPSLRKWFRYTYRVKACEVIKDPALRNWLAGIGYYHMPYLFFAGFWHIWIKDYWYPGGGMQAFHDKLAELFTHSGGELRLSTMIDRIEIRNGRARGIRTSQGELIEADRVVYTGDYKTLVGGLVDAEYFPGRFVEEIHSARLTEEILNVYLGLDRSAEELQDRLQAHHVFYFPNYDVLFPDATSDRDIHRRMWVAMNFFGDRNPGFAPEGKSTVVLQTYSSFDWERMWRNLEDTDDRTEEYRRFKLEIGRHLVELAENVLPGLDASTLFYEVGTPLSIRKFSRNFRGSTGGWCYDDRISPVFDFRRGLNLFKTPVRDLWAAGHYTLWPGGVISAALSGKIVANLVAGRFPLAALKD